MAVSFLQRWRSGRHVAQWKPTLQVFVRTGYLHRGFQTLDDGAPPIPGARVYGETQERPWTATWIPTSEWTPIEGVESEEQQQGFDNGGITVSTITVQNEGWTAKHGPLGHLYHLVERGLLAPWKGYKRATERNAWYGLLDRDAQIKVVHGYGDAVEPAFVGLIDDVDLTSRPDKLTITARDMGKVLVEEHVFGWNATPDLPEPTIFDVVGGSADGKSVGTNAQASTADPSHPARFVIDKAIGSAWRSHNHTTEDNTEWVEIHLPHGRYSHFAIQAAYPGMEVFVGIYAKSAGLGDGKLAMIEDRQLVDGWVRAVDLDKPDQGGVVPGDNGGWDYVKRFPSMSDKAHTNLLASGSTFTLGDDSVLRIGFRKLAKVGPDIYRAGVVRVSALRITADVSKPFKPRKVAEVEDVTDIVKLVLRWAGFKEWEVERTGASIRGKVSFNRQDTYMDVIKKCCEATGFLFYIKRPTEDPDSMGIPVFTSNRAIKDAPVVATLTDDQLLTNVQAKHTDEAKASIIRVRGKASKKYGLMLGAQTERRVMAIYRPPWARKKRLGGLLKHVMQDAWHLRHTADCMVMAQLIALEEALQSAQAQVEVPGNPRLGLNEHVAVEDRGTGLSTRIYVAQRQSSFTTGDQPGYKSVLGGALIDTPDVQDVLNDLRRTLRDRGAGDVISMSDVFTESST